LTVFWEFLIIKLLRVMTLTKLFRTMTLLRKMTATQQHLRDTILIFHTMDTTRIRMNPEDQHLRLILRLMVAAAVLTTLLLTPLMMLFRVIPHRPVLRLVPTIAHHRLMAAAAAADNTHLTPVEVEVAAIPVEVAEAATVRTMIPAMGEVTEPLVALWALQRGVPPKKTQFSLRAL
jgi:hypothetical protein